MDSTSTADLAERIIGTLRAHEAELRRAGIRHLSLFGSVARGDATAASDIDLAAEFDPAAHMDLFRLTALERAIELMPSQPWADIRGMGNRLRHAYDRLDLDICLQHRSRSPAEPLADARQALADLQRPTE
jgi:predicted nucleotidyltransferase